jgi:hypothetical protein
MGIVLAKCPIDSFEEVVPTAGYRGRGFSSGQSEKKYLFRRATLDERASLYQKVVDEEKALQVSCLCIVHIHKMLSRTLSTGYSI